MKYLLALLMMFTLSVNIQAQENERIETKQAIVATGADVTTPVIAVAPVPLSKDEMYQEFLKIAETVVQEARLHESPKDIAWYEVLGVVWTGLLGFLGSFLIYIRIPTKQANKILQALYLIGGFIFRDSKRGGGQHNDKILN